ETVDPPDSPCPSRTRSQPQWHHSVAAAARRRRAGTPARLGMGSPRSSSRRRRNPVQPRTTPERLEPSGVAFAAVASSLPGPSGSPVSPATVLQRKSPLKRMLINAIDPEESRIAVVEDGVLQELHVELASREGY